MNQTYLRSNDDQILVLWGIPTDAERIRTILLEQVQARFQNTINLK